jgi:hypothetical protein
LVRLGLLFSSFERAAQKKTFWGESKGFTSDCATAEHWGFESWSSESANTSGMDPMGPNPNDRSKLGHGLVNRLTNSLCLADQFGQSAQILGDSPQNQPLTKHLIPNFSSKAIFLIPLE